MILNLVGDTGGLEKGIEIFAAEFGFGISGKGLTVHACRTQKNILEVINAENGIVINYKEKIHFFRALGLLVEALGRENKFEIIETPQFTMNGAMFDVSQGNAVINVANVKNIITKMAAMGLNMLMLYVEDSYEIKGEPYFGYMRGRYTYDELKECDDYADVFGIEIIPCIQTLAHLIDVLKWPCYEDIKEDDDTLLVGNVRTYEFIEKMISAAVAPFRSKRIHIGMDEAWKLGQGKYLLLNGYKNKFDIMTEHLNRVLNIVAKMGLKPMIWSDMFFRVASKSMDDYYDIESTIPQEVISRYPKQAQLVYWDYYHHDEGFYLEWIKRHRAFGTEPIFAGGIWSWKGFCVNYAKTFVTTNFALSACKKEGVREVFATIWGDGGTESNVYSNLLGLQLFAEHGYSEQLDVDKLKKRFKFCTGGNYDDFMDITNIDKLSGTDPDNVCDYNPCKYLLWQDILEGLFDRNIEGLKMGEHYRKMCIRMEECTKTNGEIGFVFEFLAKLCRVLSIKAEMGLMITDAYKNGDLALLTKIAETGLPELEKELKILKDLHRDIWYRIYKPFGWEVMDIRYGALFTRIDTANYRLKDYLSGKIDRIEELDEERLYFNGTPGLVTCNMYSKMPTASRISFSYGF